MTSDIPALRAALHALWADDDAAARRAFETCFARDCAFYFSHPANVPGDAWTEVYGPLRAALPHGRRRDEIFITGANRREVGGTWIATFTHYVGTFAAPLWNIVPSNRLAFLRSGEFYQVENGRIIEARIILDLPDLMRQAGRDPFGGLLGTEMLFPGPATHDGILPAGDGEASLDLIEAMLGDLHVYDPETGTSKGQTGEGGYWADDMLWYGPGGIGSNHRWAGFVKDHRAPFLAAFPDRKGGNHYARIGQGNYAAISGWPSMTMTHRGPYLGMEPTGKNLTLRVMDFYRCEAGQIAENWVMLDYMDLFHQMGVDLIARAHST
ncbi:ester cyclase [Tateyamaria omphalii]|uniref:nuclear transport factor 2 family protein n=1 Tax=Tateyamaria omphalii TaxID=299262 RepID=UPI001C9928F3|nr:ester cyclase [Tateyamaria omphalii]MBY5934205.1 ester cyclase [Tateyamaria omphalii]